MSNFCSRPHRLAAVALVATLFAVAPLASQAADAGIVGNAEAAVDKVSMCIGCHGIPGYKTAYPKVYPVPRISGQTAKYIENALAAYKKGDRSHPTMRAIATSLSEQDMADLAAYYAGR